MSRYTKIASKYILSKFHQDSSQGAIYERDWTTIGNVHRLEPGKRAYYGNSNFIFTESTLPVYKKKRKNGKWVGSYIYDDVKDAEDIVNLITVNMDSEDLSDYAYWGSMTELFRGSVEHIIKTFPGRLRSTKKKLSIHHHWPEENDGVEYWTEAPGYILGNPFGIDMHTDTEDINPDEILRYVALSWRKYVVEDYERNSIGYILNYSIYEDYIEYDCEQRYFKLCNIVLFYGEGDFLIIDTYLADGKIVYCYRTKEDDGPVNPGWFDFIIAYHSGLRGTNSGSHQSAITRSGDSFVLSDDWYVPEDFAICPNSECLEVYFRNLNGFEWKLLNRRTKPFYKNTFLLPIQLESGNWRLVRRTYTWPAEGVWIDIESTDFDTFINNMISLCDVYDNIWCDSIWRCMVHESVKNFDWSYRREYDENDEADNIEGGNRMKDTMRLYGIIYDKAKRYVDGISMYNRVSYDGYNNCPNAQISDRNTLQGWDIQSTQHQFYWYELTSSKITDYGGYVALPVLPTNVDDESHNLVSVTCPGIFGTQYYTKNSLPVSEVSLDAEFFGTGSIVEKEDNPWVDTNVYGQIYVEVSYASVTPGYDFEAEHAIFDEYPYQLIGNDYPPFVMVVNGNKKKYYQLLEGESPEFIANNEKYVNPNWFMCVNENVVTPATTDILFNRELNISSNRILKSKGTKEAIDMAFALFGFGRYDEEENPDGDYIIEEQYGKYTPKDYDGTFYFYEVITEEEAEGHSPVLVDELPEYPTAGSYEYLQITTTISETSSYDTYYRLNSEYTVAEVIKMLYAHRTTERIYDDYYSGVPIKDTYIGDSHLIVPFLDSTKTYEGNLFFEGNGGWMLAGENPWDSSESIPYLHILQRISDLFTVDTSKNIEGDLYFVADVSDYYEYTDDTPYYLSNYFKLKNKYDSTRFSSWVNVPIEGPIQNGGYSGVEGVTREDYRHAKHVDSIIPSILFNNPHCGYDRYDKGSEYKTYMERPYKFSADNYLYDDDYYQNMASQFTFYHTDEVFTDGEKCLITAETVSYDGNGRSSTTPSSEQNVSVNEQVSDYVTLNDKYLKITLIDNGTPIDTTSSWYRYHLEYMRNVVMKYVAQVVPSTTILVLDNFVIPEPELAETVTIGAAIVGGEGVVYGTGSYLKTTMVTLNAVPAEGYHFVGWRGVNRNAQPPTPPAEIEPPFGSFEKTLTVMACSNMTYTAVFAEDCEIYVNCESINCGTQQPVD